MKKSFKTISIVVILVLMFLFLAGASNVNAETAVEKKKRLEKQIEEENRKKTQIKGEISRSLSSIIELKKQIQEKDNEIAGLKTEIEEAQKRVEKIEDELKILEEDCDKKEKVVKKRVTYMYEAGKYKNWEILLKSQNIMDFFSNYYMLKELAKIDNELLKEASRNKQKIELLKKEVDSKKKVLEETEEKIEKSKVIQKSLITLKEDSVKKLTQAEKNILGKLNDLEEQKQQAEAEIARAMRGYVGSGVYVGGELAWPVPGCTYISTYFGDGPAQGYYWGIHRAIDIADDYGTPIVAANAGKVILAERNGGYGNCVIIDHGGGIFTLYGHGSRILVKEGQFVARGQRIMLMGSTGMSTGPHLHFEVRKGSQRFNQATRVNPLPLVTH